MNDASLRSIQGHFLSDLHLFSRRSNFERYRDDLERIASQGELLILGGDIFDFKWSYHRTLERTIAEAIGWIEGLADRFPQCSIYYLLGNHDSHPRFVAELDRLVFEKKNLQWQPYWLRMGKLVFLHGDIIDGGMGHDEVDLRRQKHSGDPVPQAYRHLLYDLAVQAKIHRMIATVARRRNWVLKKLVRYLSEQGVDATSGITDVYFGHTHRVIDGVTYNGLTFHNGGACIKGLPFRILSFEG